MSDHRFNRNHPRFYPRALRNLALVLACLGGLAQAPALLAQTNAAGVPSNRWLLVVETSKQSRSLSNELAYVAGALVKGGMKGQVRSGDTLGLWTYSDDLHDVVFPIQVLGPGRNHQVGPWVHDFLGGRKYDKKGHFAKAVSPALDLIKDSDYITVIILSGGTEKVTGTPFDDKINDAFDTLKKQVKKEQVVVATVLRGRHGKITDYAVMLPFQGFELPPLPAELLVTNVPKSKPPPARQPTVAPLIMSGSNVISAPITNQVPGEPHRP